jgi:hypothetical protein
MKDSLKILNDLTIKSISLLVDEIERIGKKTSKSATNFKKDIPSRLEKLTNLAERFKTLNDSDEDWELDENDDAIMEDYITRQIEIRDQQKLLSKEE